MSFGETLVVVFSSPLFLFLGAATFCALLALLWWRGGRAALPLPVRSPKTVRRTRFVRFAVLLVVFTFVAGVVFGLRPSPPIQEEIQEHGCKVDAVLVLDLSGSMRPQKYHVALGALERVISGNPGSCIGLLIFGDATVVTSTPTTNHEELRHAARSQAALVARTKFPAGTNIPPALERARTMLENHDTLDAPIILFSDLQDGRQRDFMDFLAAFKDEGANLFSVGIKTPLRIRNNIAEIFGAETVSSIISQEEAEAFTLALSSSERLATTRSFRLPEGGLNERILLAVILLGVPLFISAAFFRPGLRR